MTELVLGVIDQLYTTPLPNEKKARPHKAHAAQYHAVSTGDVAAWLEDKYHVMLVFYLHHEDEITQGLCDEVAKWIKSISQGAPVPSNLYDSQMSNIQRMFKQFLSLSVIETYGIPGVPTQAALDGVSHRFKSGYNWIKVKQPNGTFKKVVGVKRPSFIDTGMYQASAKAWME